MDRVESVEVRRSGGGFDIIVRGVDAAGRLVKERGRLEPATSRADRAQIVKDIVAGVATESIG